MSDEKKLTDKDLLYSAGARCRCGAGLAYPLDHVEAMKLGAWACARVLKGEVAVEGAKDQTAAVLFCQVPPGEHDVFPFAFWKVRGETSIKNREGATTRPVGTVARTVGTATCPKCGQKWESEPYNACGLSHHWFSGPCPKCGHAVGGAGVYTSTDGPRIESRYRDVVLDDPEKKA